jgi:hypothetical protein
MLTLDEEWTIFQLCYNYNLYLVLELGIKHYENINFDL